MQPTAAIPQKKPHFSIPSIIALGAAIASFFVRPGLGVTLAVIAMVFGVIGFFLSLAPSIRGGVTSVLSMLIAVCGIVVAIIREIV